MVVLTGLLRQVVEGLILLLLGVIIGRWAQRLVLRFMKEVEINRLFRKATKIRASLDKFVSLWVAYTIYLITVILVGLRLGVVNWVLWILAGIVVLVVAAAVLLYLVTLVPNLWAHFSLRHSGLVVGKELYIKGVFGRIDRFYLQDVKLDSGVYVPYYYLLKNKFECSHSTDGTKPV